MGAMLAVWISCIKETLHVMLRGMFNRIRIITFSQIFCWFCKGFVRVYIAKYLPSVAVAATPAYFPPMLCAYASYFVATSIVVFFNPQARDLHTIL